MLSPITCSQPQQFVVVEVPVFTAWPATFDGTGTAECERFPSEDLHDMDEAHVHATEFADLDELRRGFLHVGDSLANQSEPHEENAEWVHPGIGTEMCCSQCRQILGYAAENEDGDSDCFNAWEEVGYLRPDLIWETKNVAAFESDPAEVFLLCRACFTSLDPRVDSIISGIRHAIIRNVSGNSISQEFAKEDHSSLDEIGQRAIDQLTPRGQNNNNNNNVEFIDEAIQVDHVPNLQQYRSLFTRIYESHCPEKLEKVDELIVKYIDRVEQLCHDICHKYGPDTWRIRAEIFGLPCDQGAQTDMDTALVHQAVQTDVLEDTKASVNRSRVESEAQTSEKMLSEAEQMEACKYISEMTADKVKAKLEEAFALRERSLQTQLLEMTAQLQELQSTRKLQPVPEDGQSATAAQDPEVEMMFASVDELDRYATNVEQEWHKDGFTCQEHCEHEFSRLLIQVQRLTDRRKRSFHQRSEPQCMPQQSRTLQVQLPKGKGKRRK